MISYKGAKIVAIWQHYKQVLCIFLLRMHRNGYLVASCQKSDPAIRSGDLGDLDFQQNICISTTKLRLRDIIDVCVLLRRRTLWPRPLTF